MAANFILRGPDMELPWSSTRSDDQRFYRILLISVALLLLVSLPIGFIHLPELPRAQKEKLPPQLARVMLERKLVPPPVKADIKPEVKAAEPVPEPVKAVPKPAPSAEVAKAPAAEAPATSAARPQPSAAAVAQARERAQNAGVLQASNELAQMRSLLQTSAVADAPVATGTQSANAAQAAKTERNLIDSGAKTTSGGVNSAALSRDTATAALAGQQQTQVASTLGEQVKPAAQAKAGTSDGAGSSARSEEEIRRVMNQNRGAIDIIYQRALRQNAALQGKLVVKLVIDPSGRVIEASVVSSELGDADLESKILNRIRLISFPAANVQRTTVNQTFDFFPQ